MPSLERAPVAMPRGGRYSRGMERSDADESTDLALWAHAALTAVAPPAEVRRLLDAVLPVAVEAYESALVQGLCREGARELLETTAAEEARRLLALR